MDQNNHLQGPRIKPSIPRNRKAQNQFGGPKRVALNPQRSSVEGHNFPFCKF